MKSSVQQKKDKALTTNFKSNPSESYSGAGQSFLTHASPTLTTSPIYAVLRDSPDLLRSMKFEARHSKDGREYFMRSILGAEGDRFFPEVPLLDQHLSIDALIPRSGSAFEKQALSAYHFTEQYGNGLVIHVHFGLDHNFLTTLVSLNGKNVGDIVLPDLEAKLARITTRINIFMKIIEEARVKLISETKNQIEKDCQAIVLAASLIDSRAINKDFEESLFTITHNHRHLHDLLNTYNDYHFKTAFRMEHIDALVASVIEKVEFHASTEATFNSLIDMEEEARCIVLMQLPKSMKDALVLKLEAYDEANKKQDSSSDESALVDNGSRRSSSSTTPRTPRNKKGKKLEARAASRDMRKEEDDFLNAALEDLKALSERFDLTTVTSEDGFKAIQKEYEWFKVVAKLVVEYRQLSEQEKLRSVNNLSEVMERCYSFAAYKRINFFKSAVEAVRVVGSPLQVVFCEQYLHDLNQSYVKNYFGFFNYAFFFDSKTNEEYLDLLISNGHYVIDQAKYENLAKLYQQDYFVCKGVKETAYRWLARTHPEAWSYVLDQNRKSRHLEAVMNKISDLITDLCHSVRILFRTKRVPNVTPLQETARERCFVLINTIESRHHEPICKRIDDELIRKCFGYEPGYFTKRWKELNPEPDSAGNEAEEDGSVNISSRPKND